MNNAVINIKINSETKEQASKVAEDLGFSLSSLINAYLKDLVRTKSVHFSIGEQPSAYLKEELQKSQQDIENGELSPQFSNSKDALEWLKSPDA